MEFVQTSCLQIIFYKTQTGTPQISITLRCKFVTTSVKRATIDTYIMLKRKKVSFQIWYPQFLTVWTAVVIVSTTFNNNFWHLKTLRHWEEDDGHHERSSLRNGIVIMWTIWISLLFKVNTVHYRASRQQIKFRSISHFTVHRNTSHSSPTDGILLTIQFFYVDT